MIEVQAKSVRITSNGIEVSGVRCANLYVLIDGKMIPANQLLVQGRSWEFEYDGPDHEGKSMRKVFGVQSVLDAIYAFYIRK